MPVSRVSPADFDWGSADGPAAALASVCRACLESEAHDPLNEAARLRLKHDGLSESDLWLVDGAGSTAGFALRHGSEVDLAVAPRARSRGLGSALAAVALSGDGPVTAWSHGDHPAAARLAAAHHLERAREMWVLRRSTAARLPDVPAAEGVVVRTFATDDMAELLRVNAAAFAHHPEQGAMDAANLAERMDESWFDPAGLIVAVDGPRMLGFHWTKRHSPSLGEVYVVGIDPRAQGRGLGKLLTLAGLHHLAGTGVESVMLYVESDNAPAISVYSGLGFDHAPGDTHVQYRRGPRPAGPPAPTR